MYTRSHACTRTHAPTHILQQQKDTTNEKLYPLHLIDYNYMSVCMCACVPLCAYVSWYHIPFQLSWCCTAHKSYQESLGQLWWPRNKRPLSGVICCWKAIDSARENGSGCLGVTFPDYIYTFLSIDIFSKGGVCVFYCVYISGCLSYSWISYTVVRWVDNVSSNIVIPRHERIRNIQRNGLTKKDECKPISRFPRWRTFKETK